MKNEFLRHTLSTIKYRFDKVIDGSKDGFGEFSLGYGSRSPQEIVHHMHDVLYRTRVFLESEVFDSEEFVQMKLEQEVDRFKAELTRVDLAMNANELEVAYSKKLVQGPLADALTHIGQIAMLQRIHGNPVTGEDFSRVDIKTGLN
jgi:hypothetical protein